MKLSRELRIYVCFTSDPDVGTDNPQRDDAIQAELVAIRDAPTLAEAMAVIDWWGWDTPQQQRAFTRELRRRLRRGGKDAHTT